MGVTFYVCDVAMATALDKLVDAMDQEDALEDVPDSAYDRFGQLLQSNHLFAQSLSEDDSEPAEGFYEWFHDRISDHLDKLYMTPAEATQALEKLDKVIKKSGLEKVVNGFHDPADLYTRETAQRYLEQFQQVLARAVELKGLFAVGYHHA